MGRRVIKLNLGCGPSGIDGWINYDWGVLPWLSKIKWLRTILVKCSILPVNYDVGWPEIKLVDIRRGLPLDNAGVDCIYCSHVLEHLEDWEARLVLRECRRVLKKGGLLRLVVPDLVKMIKEYRGADEFCREFYGFDKDKRNRMRIFIREHKWMYDKNSLRERLREAGFIEIKLVRWRQGKMPDLKRLDISIHKRLSLYYECVA